MNGAGGATVLQMGYAGNPRQQPLPTSGTNTGTIDVTDTDLRLGGYFTQADVGTINRSGGTVKLNGFLENSWPDAGHHRGLAARRPAAWPAARFSGRHRPRQRRRQPVLPPTPAAARWTASRCTATWTSPARARVRDTSPTGWSVRDSQRQQPGRGQRHGCRRLAAFAGHADAGQGDGAPGWQLGCRLTCIPVSRHADPGRRPAGPRSTAPARTASSTAARSSTKAAWPSATARPATTTSTRASSPTRARSPSPRQRRCTLRRGR
jgi:hypothetical protein